MQSLHETIERAKKEVLADIANGYVPDTVSSFSELHDYVDANYYGGGIEACGEDLSADEFWDYWNKVQDTINEWLVSGEHRNPAGQGVTDEQPE